jgi:signal transduction histidine kinase/pSer/pThr/pTyr-binding forkhead associated (FHA) protein
MSSPRELEQERQQVRHLLVIDDAAGRRPVQLEAATYSIGRDATNSIVLHSKLVSRQHAILLRVTAPDSSNFLFRIVDGDLQGKRSTNGILVNGHRCYSHDLKQGDSVVFGGDVKARYYAVSNLSDEEFGGFFDSTDLSGVLAKVSNPFQTLVPMEDRELADLSEAALVRLASYPELTPNPILEIDLNGIVTYLNPAAVLEFPTIQKQGVEHPILAGLLNMIKVLRETHEKFFVREVEIGDKVFEQHVHYISESDLIRSYVTDITERKRAEEQLRQQAQREAVINRIVQAMRGTLVADEVLQIMSDLLLEALDASHCLITQQGSPNVLAAHHARASLPVHLDAVNQRFLEYYQSSLDSGNQIQLSNGDTSIDLELQALLQQCGTTILVITPLIYMGNCLGSISLYHGGSQSRNQTNSWTADELALIQTIADQGAIAIHQARLYQQVQELNTDLEQQVQERTAELQQKMLELQQLNALKDDFLSTVSHELRTPMANIKMAIHILKQFPMDQRQERYLNILNNECARETELINNLLDLQRLESGSQPIGQESLNLDTWLPTVLEAFQTRSQQRHQNLQIHCPSNLPSLQSNRHSIERVLAELLNNACKYTAADGEISLTVVLVEPNGIQFRVANQSEIAASELPRIFDKFYRVPNADPWKQGGTGLGLALVKKLVQQLQGDIQVTSEAGVTTFIVDLPRSFTPTLPAPVS